MSHDLVPRIERMAATASARLSDADVLEQSLRSTSDSAYLLRLLGFEILLKALVRLSGGGPQNSHSYFELFHLLPVTVRDRVLAGAATRMGGSVSYSNLPELLTTFANNFVRLRYPYEAYEQVSAGAYKGAGDGWVAKGAPESEATLVYYPEELFGLTFALASEIQEWLKTSR